MDRATYRIVVELQAASTNAVSNDALASGVVGAFENQSNINVTHIEVASIDVRQELPDRESELKQRLSELYAYYQDEAKPIIDELVEIENRKPPKPVIIINAGGGMLGSLGELLQQFVANGGGEDGPCGDPNCPFCNITPTGKPH